jgi:DNA mismatch repair protein MutL
VYLHAVAKIHLLPDTLINQIAAGEVVERPASVVKELIENSLDASARSIRIRLQDGGRSLIEVEDDGAGMDEEDARLALARHATSKLSTADQLVGIETLGFRGEALPSIAAVAELTLETAPSDGAGTRIDVSFGQVGPIQPCVRARGTRIAIRDLFAQLPARRKFLRADSTELRHVVTTVLGLAFAHPGVGFQLAHGARSLLALPPSRDAATRLPDLVGAEKARAARPVRHCAGHITVSGFLLPPTSARETIVVVNGRVVRDRLLSVAINRTLRAAGGTLEADTYLDIRMPVESVDVNVHPTKAEVRFADPGRVMAAVTESLAAARVALHGPVDIRRVVTVMPTRPHSPQLPFSTPAQPPPEWPAHSTPSKVAETPPVGYAPAAAATSPFGRYVGQYRDTYLLVEDADGLLLVDQHAAHERVLFEALLSTNQPVAVQRLLLPEVIDLPPALAAIATSAVQELQALGVEIDEVSGSSVRVLGLPTPLPTAAAPALLRQLLADLAEPAGTPGQSIRERAAASLACQAAIKKHRPMSRAEAEQLLLRLAALHDPHRCPHGRPTIIKLSHHEIERRIGRK